MSPVSINQLETTVTPERLAPAGAQEPASVPPWVEADRVRAAAAELERDRVRLRAEGLDA
jgi:hypothetical protein